MTFRHDAHLVAGAYAACHVLSDAVTSASELTTSTGAVGRGSCVKATWQEKPAVRFPAADHAKTYAIVSIDPDARNRDRGEYYPHWIVANVPGRYLASGNVSGKTIIEYKGPCSWRSRNATRDGTSPQFERDGNSRSRRGSRVSARASADPSPVRS